MDVTEWDVEKYKVEHECDEHWDLRKSFLEAHKDRFAIDQLVCLAQVFTNIELLGCRYPEETMDLVAELSEDIAKDYRERQKTKLQRTFVKASDAASSKAKGRSSTTPSSTNSSPITKNFDNNKNDNVRKYETNDDNISCKKTRIDKNNQPYGKLVLFQYPNQAPASIIDSLGRLSAQPIECKHEVKKLDDDKNDCKCEIFIGGKFLSSGNGKTKKLARAAASEIGLQILRKYYYLIEVKTEWKDNLIGDSNKLVKTDESENSSCDKKKNESDKLLGDNVGAKLMKLMGWAGGGLGKSEQGITEPVTVDKTISRRGFGMKLTSKNMRQFKQKCLQTFKQYIIDGDKNDLIFADFEKEERAIMHQCAKQVGLKSNSINRNGKRTLLVSRKIDPNDLVDELLTVGGSTEKYTLLFPTDN
ncbi:hypothetical protein HCN44_000611 [Aphidius gifuensis]|uniref:NF-kappa-B-repressing factor n=1 Tax=Aphidius gifuensis TaxID=684658 RepID=A0A834XQ16_APHGI|nr:NF-kappa-B-repressing factor [Aphidius gifuensis]KAF7990806.1 hypothetical protein HCN44_000611 [Aphidius gifuensis]